MWGGGSRWEDPSTPLRAGRRRRLKPGSHRGVGTPAGGAADGAAEVPTQRECGFGTEVPKHQELRRAGVPMQRSSLALGG